MINALLVLDKPAALTSHDVVNRVRRITGERSVGHLGTLDPMATGVLPLLLGRFTRLAQFFNDSRKVYEGEIRFGFATDTFDCQGEPVGVLSSAQPSLGEIQGHLSALTGRIQQTPPVYSAKKIHGVPAYKLARQDKVVEMKPVAVEVHRFEIQSVWADRARFVAVVSAGTYVRSLAHDLGQALGCGAHLTQLRRIQAGEFDLSQAVTLEELGKYHNAVQSSSPSAVSSSAVSLVGAATPSLSSMSDNEYSDKPTAPPVQELPRPSPYLHPRQILSGFPSVTAPPQVIAAIRNGRSVNLPEFSDAPLVKVFAGQLLLVAVVQRIAGTLFQPRVVLFGSNEALPTMT
jgi:tRNA pseudouridine55 synthase